MDYELECDAAKFFSTEAMPQLYTTYAGVNYAINERPADKGGVDLGMKIVCDGIYTISAARMDAAVLLIDHETGYIHDLSVSDYTFNCKAGVYDQRFSIELKDMATGIETFNNMPKQTKSTINNVEDLSGRHLPAVQKGVNIVDGKKVLIK